MGRRLRRKENGKQFSETQSPGAGAEDRRQIGLVCTVLGAVISYATLSRNRDKDREADGQQSGMMLSELGYIKANTDEIKAEQREQRKINTELYTKLSAVEASAKSAHHRLDRMEGKIDHETH